MNVNVQVNANVYAYVSWFVGALQFTTTKKAKSSSKYRTYWSISDQICCLLKNRDFPNKSNVYWSAPRGLWVVFFSKIGRHCCRTTAGIVSQTAGRIFWTVRITQNNPKDVRFPISGLYFRSRFQGHISGLEPRLRFQVLHFRFGLEVLGLRLRFQICISALDFRF